jgi:uroporphyrinogen decarboxylase
MAVAMSLQPWHAFGTDGVIMFSDILTPWPVFGVEFDVVRGKGPQIPQALNSLERMAAVKSPNTPEEFAEKLPFIAEILGTLRKETEGRTTLIGFVGSPWTLTAYAMEGGGTKNAETAMRLMQTEPAAVKELLTKVAEGIAAYAAYQVSCGAQVIQVFESWAHQLSPGTFDEFAKPYADLCMRKIKERCPDTPVIYFANGGSGFLERQGDMAADMICLDWKCDMAVARAMLGEDRGVSGNVDPRILHSGTEEQIRQAVRDCAGKAKGAPFVLNLGHGVMQGTPESSVAAFCDEARKVKL